MPRQREQGLNLATDQEKSDFIQVLANGPMSKVIQECLKTRDDDIQYGWFNQILVTAAISESEERFPESVWREFFQLALGIEDFGLYTSEVLSVAIKCGNQKVLGILISGSLSLIHI